MPIAFLPKCDILFSGFRIPIELISSEMARVTAGYIQSGAFAHIQELDSWAGDLRSSAFLRLETAVSKCLEILRACVGPCGALSVEVSVGP